MNNKIFSIVFFLLFVYKKTMENINDKEFQEKLNKEFKIIGVCREDILMEDYPENFVKSLDDASMEYIAEKMSDVIDMDIYWEILHAICDELLKNYKKEQREIKKNETT